MPHTNLRTSVLHQDGGAKGRTAEEEANRFASAFLMPRSDVLAAAPQVCSVKQLIAEKKRWKVSVAALNYRLHKLGIVSEWKNRELCIAMVKQGYNKEEPEPMEREKSVVWEKMLKSLWAEKTTHLDIAEQLTLPVSEVSDLLFGLLNNVPKEHESPLSVSIIPDHEDSQPKVSA